MIFCIIFLVFLVLFFVPFLLGGVTKFITNLIITMNKLIINHHPLHHQGQPNRQEQPHVDHPQPVGLFPGKYSVAMVKGDCSLTISNVDLKIDDGEWECQVCGRQIISPIIIPYY